MKMTSNKNKKDKKDIARKVESLNNYWVTSVFGWVIDPAKVIALREKLGFDKCCDDYICECLEDECRDHIPENCYLLRAQSMPDNRPWNMYFGYKVDSGDCEDGSIEHLTHLVMSDWASVKKYAVALGGGGSAKLITVLDLSRY